MAFIVKVRSYPISIDYLLPTHALARTSPARSTRISTSDGSTIVRSRLCIEDFHYGRKFENAYISSSSPFCNVLFDSEFILLLKLLRIAHCFLPVGRAWRLLLPLIMKALHLVLLYEAFVLDIKFNQPVTMTMTVTAAKKTVTVSHCNSQAKKETTSLTSVRTPTVGKASRFCPWLLPPRLCQSCQFQQCQNAALTMRSRMRILIRASTIEMQVKRNTLVTMITL